jgi:Icc-related predicted phosphoesterase
MLIAALSDTHNQQFSRQCQPTYCMQNKYDPIDVLVHAGDFTVRGKPGEVHGFADWIEEIAPFFKAVIFIVGNHDSLASMNPVLFKSYFKNIPNCHYLQDSGVEIDGIKFWGSPSTTYVELDGRTRKLDQTWAFGRRPEKLKDYWKLIPDHTDVLITHSPAYSIGDKHKNNNFGCPDLLERINTIKPKLHIFGHIHSGRGTYKVNDKTTAINVAMLDDHYKMQSESVTYIYV